MFNNINNFIIDMDGVLWHGETPLPGLNAFFDALNAGSYPFVLATNNASKTPAQYVEKLDRFGVQVLERQILTSAIATADFLGPQYPAGTRAYVSGGKGIQEAMKGQGFELVPKAAVRQGAEAPLVVVGLSFETCYEDLAAAAVLINKGARFIGTNPDTTFPSDWGTLPGAGSFLALLETATGQKPLIIGKPEPYLFNAALHRLNASPLNCAMIGDRLNTDITGAAAVGLHTILVLSGITPANGVQNGPIQPNFVFNNITEITAQLLLNRKL